MCMCYLWLDPSYLHLMSFIIDQSFPVFHCSSASGYYCEHNNRIVKQGRPKNKATVAAECFHMAIASGQVLARPLFAD